MKRERMHIFFVLIFFLLSFEVLGIGVELYVRAYPLVLTGEATSPGNITLTTAGTAGISLSDDTIAFGSGYYNSSCSLSYAEINANGSSLCWINVTSFPRTGDSHTLINTGTTVVNITVSLVNISDAEQLFCGNSQACAYSNSSEILIQSVNAEANSCSGLTNGFESIATNSSNQSIGACDILDFSDDSDSLSIYVALHLPRDASAGNKTLLIDYEASASS